MINRKAIAFLRAWRESSIRKPLVLRGARQVGKTTLIETFAKEYKVFLHLNLEKQSDIQIFEDYTDIHELIRAIFVHRQREMTDEPTLLFIDEIQNSKKAVAMLRYFYEEANHIHVIAAGSLLETVMDVRSISFPVGRVEYMALRPCSFLEFMTGLGEDFDARLVENLEARPAHSRIQKLFNDYVVVGGMPEVVARYAEKRDILALHSIYKSLLYSYKDDVEKYTSNADTLEVIRSILDVGWYSASERISFEKFGQTRFSSREMSIGFKTIQKSMLLELVFPTAETQMPLLRQFRKHPKLIWLDTGLVNFVSGVQKEVFSVKDVQEVWRGRIAEHIVAQELLTLNNDFGTHRIFWRRNREGSESEVDFVHPFDGLAIPVEVKSGHNARLKSLHMFMDEAPHRYAVRVWSQPFSVDEVTTPKGKTFSLINLPFYYVGLLEKVLERIIHQQKIDVGC